MKSSGALPAKRKRGRSSANNTPSGKTSVSRLWMETRSWANTGKSVAEIRIRKKKKIEENLFPQFTTWRELIDGYWFPTFSSADDTLHFTNRDVRIKQVLKFTDYKKAGGGTHN